MKDRGTAIVTGGRRGIGAAISQALAHAGFAVAIVDVVADEAGERTAAAITQDGGRAKFFRADVADLASHPPLIARATQALGPLTCLVNNAGIQVPVRGDILVATPDAFDRVIDVNLRGTFFLTQAVARHMVREDAQGRARAIVIISSANAHMASPEKHAYCISKSALSMVASLFALRLAEHGIDVFEVQPGLIRTDMTAPVRESYGRQIAAGLTPNRRWGEPEEVAQTVTTLVTGGLPFCTGSVISVGGGLHVHRL
jgi:NAD(P)-dependent dehydrogenase (short-subunit alcohol dehydrogenase family)